MFLYIAACVILSEGTFAAVTEPGGAIAIQYLLYFCLNPVMLGLFGTRGRQSARENFPPRSYFAGDNVAARAPAHRRQALPGIFVAGIARNPQFGFSCAPTDPVHQTSPLHN